LRTDGRHIRPNVVALRTARLLIELAPGQVFCETSKAYETWENGRAMRRIKRIEKARVYWVIMRDGEEVEKHEDQMV